MFAAAPLPQRATAEPTNIDHDEPVRRTSRERESDQSFDEIAKLFAFLGIASESAASPALATSEVPQQAMTSGTPQSSFDSLSLANSSVITSAAIAQSGESALGTQHAQIISANLEEQITSDEDQLILQGEFEVESYQKPSTSPLLQQDQTFQSEVSAISSGLHPEIDASEKTKTAINSDTPLQTTEPPVEATNQFTEGLVELQDQVQPKSSLLEVTSAKVIHQVVTETLGQMGVIRNGDSSSITVRLDPPELGEVLVRIKKLDGGISMRIAAIEPTTMQLLQDHQADLSGTLSQGETHVSMEFGTAADFQESFHASDDFTSQASRSMTSAEEKLIQPKEVVTSPSGTENNIHDFLA